MRTDNLTIQHHKSINGTPALRLAIEAEAHLQAHSLIGPYQLTQWNQQALTAWLGNEIVGILTYQDEDWRNEFAVILGYVVPHHRNQGIYRALWEALIIRARDAGRPRIIGGTSPHNTTMLSTMEALGRRAFQILFAFDVPESTEPFVRLDLALECDAR